MNHVFDTIPAPWTPVTCAAKPGEVRLGILGRTCTFQNNLLPTSLETGGQELLAAPMRLVAFAAWISVPQAAGHNWTVCGLKSPCDRSVPRRGQGHGEGLRRARHQGHSLCFRPDWIADT